MNGLAPDGFGVSVRTVAQNQNQEAIEEDLQDVLKKWEKLTMRLEEDGEPPDLLHNDLDMTESLIRTLHICWY